MTDDTAASIPPPQKVTLRHREVMAAAIASSSRIRGAGTWLGAILFALLCAAVWLGHLFAFWFVQQLPFAAMFAIGVYLPTVIPAFFALVAVKIALDLEQRRAQRAYLRRLTAIGAPLEREGSYEVTEDALVLTTGRMVLAPRWAAIDTIERGDKGWVLSADQLHFLIPFADFPSVDAQRPLLAAITARMTSEARARSRDAVDFAGGGAVSPQASEPAASLSTTTSPDGDDAIDPPDLPIAIGWLTQDQAGWAAGRIYHRIVHPRFHAWAYPLTAGVTGAIVAILLLGIIAFFVPPGFVRRFPAAVYYAGLTIPLAGGALGLAHGNRRLVKVLEKAWRGGLAARGVPDQIEARWTLTETGIAYRTARFAGEAAYASLHQLLHEGGYWIAAADTLTLCIPDAAFASASDAETFMAALLRRMSEPARARSVNPSLSAS